MTKNKVLLSPAQNGFLAANLKNFSADTWSISVAGQAGSERRFVRTASPDGSVSAVLIIWDSLDKDWDRFIGIESEVSARTSLLPNVFAVDARHGLILEEDLGSSTLHRYCSSGDVSVPDIRDVYQRALDALKEWQRMPIDGSSHLASRAMDMEMFLWESEYFALHCVTEYFGKEILLDTAWKKEKIALAEELAAMPRVCIHRDFQSENIMVTSNGIRFVDFQGARLGPAGYDLASLLCDPYADCLDESFCEKLFNYYNGGSSSMRLDWNSFRLCAVSRLMQALGAYANLSLHKGKDRYRQFVPVALERLEISLDKLHGLSALRRIVSECREV